MIANVFEGLPPSSFNIDDWKKQWLNSTNQQEDFKWFWKHFDPEGWSIWEINYQKGAKEGATLSSFQNICNGFIQRTSQNLKRYCFAIQGIYGKEPNLEIKGVWLWRGNQIPPQITDHPQFEYLIFVKLDHKKQADKELFQEYWINTDQGNSEVNGNLVQYVQYFK